RRLPAVRGLLPVIDEQADAGLGCSLWYTLLPVVAEDVVAGELLHRDLRLAGAIGSHQRDVLPRSQRSLGKEHFVAGRDGDEEVGGDRLLTRRGHARAELLRRRGRTFLRD